MLYPICEHKHYVLAGYLKKRNGEKLLRVQSAYHIFCLDCKKYIHLMTGEDLSGKGLTHQRKGGDLKK